MRNPKSNRIVQLKPLIEGMLMDEREQQIAQLEKQGRKVVRWGYTVRKFWHTPWGILKRVRIPRLRDQGEIGLLEKYLPHEAALPDRADRRQKRSREFWAVWAFFLSAGCPNPRTFSVLAPEAGSPKPPESRSGHAANYAWLLLSATLPDIGSMIAVI